MITRTSTDGRLPYLMRSSLRTFGLMTLVTVIAGCRPGAGFEGRSKKSRQGQGEMPAALPPGGVPPGVGAARPGGNGLRLPVELLDENHSDPEKAAAEAAERAKALAPAASAVWKRYKAFEQGLASALELRPNELCQEIGRRSCISDVHLTVLGGNEPYYYAQYERLLQPSILTSIAVERIVLSACSVKLRSDVALGAGATVFKSILSQALSPSTVAEQTKDFYQRFLARDPTQEELATAQKLMAVATTPEKAATAICFLVGTHAENLFL